MKFVKCKNTKKQTKKKKKEKRKPIEIYSHGASLLSSKSECLS